MFLVINYIPFANFLVFKRDSLYFLRYNSFLNFKIIAPIISLTYFKHKIDIEHKMFYSWI